MNDENLRVVDDSAKSASDYLDTLRIASPQDLSPSCDNAWMWRLRSLIQYASVALQGLDDWLVHGAELQESCDAVCGRSND